MIAAGPAGAMLASGVGFEVLALPWLTRPSRRAGGVLPPGLTGIPHAQALPNHPEAAYVYRPVKAGWLLPKPPRFEKGEICPGF